MRDSPGTLKKSPGVFFCPGKEAGMADRMDSLDEIRSLTPEVVRQMGDMLSKDKVPPMAKVRIMEIILERTYGKPETSIKLTNAQQNVEAAQERIAAIVEGIRKKRVASD